MREYTDFFHGNQRDEHGNLLWAAELFRKARKIWGKLQQVRSGTRVLCIYCAGRGCPRGCPMCDGGFMDRDTALWYLEGDMECLEK